jgi:hypothetical protein
MIGIIATAALVAFLASSLAFILLLWQAPHSINDVAGCPTCVAAWVVLALMFVFAVAVIILTILWRRNAILDAEMLRNEQCHALWIEFEQRQAYDSAQRQAESARVNHILES